MFKAFKWNVAYANVGKDLPIKNYIKYVNYYKVPKYLINYSKTSHFNFGKVHIYLKGNITPKRFI